MTATKIALVGIGKIARDQHIPALAASNAFALESNAQEINLTSAQFNNSLTTAVSNVSIGYTNALKSSSVAIGNQVSIAPIAIK